jgi:hypothetical protein
LIALKYVVEAAILWMAKGNLLTPSEFVDPLASSRLALFGDVGAGTVFVWTLPFVWIGLTMSFRRAIDAGYRATTGAIFLLPYVNWVMIVWLSCAPSRPTGYRIDKPYVGIPPPWAVILASFAGGCGIGGGMVALSVYVLHDYGGTLFVATPVVMGMVSATIASRYGRLGYAASVSIGQSALILSLLAMVGMAVEGLFCVLMAWPLAAILVWFGSVLGWFICGRGSDARRTFVYLAVLSLPSIAWQESRQRTPLLHEVISSVEITAPPDVVWKCVVSFPDLPPPDGVFSLGIACPLRARITGTGVGAVRYCEFTTGPFIEPITVWEPGRRLAFDVIAQPPAMRELSFWSDVKAPHLDGYLNSRRGEFRLIAFPGGRTKLEGSTWYEVDIHPEGYWSLWADGFIHAIHDRVLRHIARLAESSAQSVQIDHAVGAP